MPNVPRVWKSFWSLQIILLGNVGQVEACFVPFGDCVNLAQHRYTYVLNVPWAWKSFWALPMVLLGVVSLVEARVGPFGGSVSLSAR